MGIFESKVEDLDYEYARPQENGYRTDNRWLQLTDHSGNGLLIKGDSLFNFSAHHNLIKDFDPGMKKAQRHNIDIKRRNLIQLNIDYQQTGVGGDDSWGARPWEKYTIMPQNLTYSFEIRIAETFGQR